jgi:hypothetical protein
MENHQLHVGVRVKHATRTDWGLGEVLSREIENRAQIIFEDVAKIISFDLSIAKFITVTGDEASSDYLTALVKRFREDAAAPKSNNKKVVATTSFPKAVANFLSIFPEGFRDQRYLAGRTGEREYKLAANRLMMELLDKDTFFSLLESGAFKEICSRAKSVINKTNLIHTYEKIWLNNALVSENNQRIFASGLFELLYGDSALQSRFEKFAAMLYEINAAKWPIATYFLFIRFPESQIFVKPQVTQNAAEVLGMSINYRPELNWLTYSQVLNLAQNLKAKLEKTDTPALLPEDMIDVQSFIWVTAPSYYS